MFLAARGPRLLKKQWSLIINNLSRRLTRAAAGRELDAHARASSAQINNHDNRLNFNVIGGILDDMKAQPEKSYLTMLLLTKAESTFRLHLITIIPKKIISIIHMSVRPRLWHNLWEWEEILAIIIIVRCCKISSAHLTRAWHWQRSLTQWIHITSSSARS